MGTHNQVHLKVAHNSTYTLLRAYHEVSSDLFTYIAYPDTHLEHYYTPAAMAMQQAAAQSSRVLFRCTGRLTGKHASIVESERLKAQPVVGFNSWYETGHENNVAYAKRVYFQNVENGTIRHLDLSSHYPRNLPAEFSGTGSQSIRDYV